MAEATAAAASAPRARKCNTVPLEALTRMILTGLLASSHGPSGASDPSRSEANDLASCVSFTDGLACRPTALVSLALATTKLFDIRLSSRSRREVLGRTADRV